MCGIVGYSGDKDTCEILLNSLERLEYRGYDSAGIAVFTDDGVMVCRSKGRLNDVRQKLSGMTVPPCVCGIGHTRWATHGEPSDQNSHPHREGRVTLVHNGIIENFIRLKEMLIKKGYEFNSQTDTETIVKLIDHYYMDDPIEAIVEATLRLTGSYALAVMFDDLPNELFALRKDSPLIVGVGKDECFIASDIPAILKYTRDYYLLEEGEIAHLKDGKAVIVDFDGNPIEKELKTADWDVGAAEKGGYPHFMLKEINEQPTAIKNTISLRIKDDLPDFSADGIPDSLFENTRMIHVIACGTAMHAGMVGKNAIEELAGITVQVDVASEFRYRNPVMSPDDVCIIISQSGETADTLAALRLCKERGVKTLAVVNVVGSSIAREADMLITTLAGPEIAVASTKAYSVQVSVLLLLSVRFGMARGLPIDRARELTRAVASVPGLLGEMLTNTESIQNISAMSMNTHDLFFIGRGIDYSMSMEGSLKLKEISYIHSEAYAAGELKHGTISLVVQDTPVVAVATQERLFEKMVSNIREVKARGAKVILLCKQGTVGTHEIADYIIELPCLPDLLSPLLAVLPLQLFAYYTAVYRGCDVDKPRNLAKSVTVE